MQTTPTGFLVIGSLTGNATTCLCAAAFTWPVRIKVPCNAACRLPEFHYTGLFRSCGDMINHIRTHSKTGVPRSTGRNYTIHSLVYVDPDLWRQMGSKQPHNLPGFLWHPLLCHRLGKPQHINRTGRNLVNDVRHILRFQIEGRYRRQNNGTEFRCGCHVSQMRQC